MEKEYWKNYYANNFKPFMNSTFSEFCLSHLRDNETILDCGCGNGRDSIFFAKWNMNVLGIDQCSNIIEHLNSITDFPNLRFKTCTFENLDMLKCQFDHIYLRFVLHSIEEDLENLILDWVKANITKNIFIETRSVDDYLNTRESDHFRRFTEINDILVKLIDHGFDIKYAEISRGFSKYKKEFNVDYNEEDPKLIRVVASVK
jgi:tellurite methyltransferase